MEQLDSESIVGDPEVALSGLDSEEDVALGSSQQNSFPNPVPSRTRRKLHIICRGLIGRHLGP
jgi:hypothetical protein